MDGVCELKRGTWKVYSWKSVSRKVGGRTLPAHRKGNDCQQAWEGGKEKGTFPFPPLMLSEAPVTLPFCQRKRNLFLGCKLKTLVGF